MYICICLAEIAAYAIVTEPGSTLPASEVKITDFIYKVLNNVSIVLNTSSTPHCLSSKLATIYANKSKKFLSHIWRLPLTLIGLYKSTVVSVSLLP